MQFDQIERREFIALLGGAAVAWPLAAYAQQTATKAPHIAVLAEGGENTFGRLVEAFRLGLLELGYVEGQSVHIEYRWGDGEMTACAAMPPNSWPLTWTSSSLQEARSQFWPSNR